MLETIMKDVAKHCGIPIKKMSFKDLWLKSPPKDAAGKSLHGFLQDVSSPRSQTSLPKCLNSFVYDFSQNSDEFRASYEQKYHRAPYANKVTRWRW